MLFRDLDDGGLLGIPQPAHALISGQLARAWGGGFGPPPDATVALTAELHDLAWLPWEAAPDFDPATGLPTEFRHVPARVHAPLWTAGVAAALASYGRLPALLIALHGLRLHGRSPLAGRPPEDAAALERFRVEMAAVASRLRGELASEGWDAVAVDHASALVGVWDHLSLRLCFGVREPSTVPAVPTAAGPRDLVLTPVADTPERVGVAPWPFAGPTVALAVEGTVLPRAGYPDAAAMRAALPLAPRRCLGLRLEPAG